MVQLYLASVVGRSGVNSMAICDAVSRCALWQSCSTAPTTVKTHSPLASSMQAQTSSPKLCPYHLPHVPGKYFSTVHILKPTGAHCQDAMSVVPSVRVGFRGRS